ncbi:MAG: TolC family protein [Proteobacteria bacterium]|nr:TolC family protein [Pseudomonadota bacterium]
MNCSSKRPGRACRGRYALLATIIFAVCVEAAPSGEPSVTPNLEEPVGELTLAQAIGTALARNPDLTASAYELKAADARIVQARLRPNPEVSVQLDNIGISGEARGTDVLASTLSLSQVIEMGGKRALRTEVANYDRDAVGVERQAQQLDVLAEVARRFIAVVAAQERRVFAQSARELAQRTLDAISARLQAARSPEAERSRAGIALTRMQIEEQQADSELRSARSALAALWGSQAPRFTQARADLFALDPVEPFEALVSKLERSPDFVRFASEARLRDAELRLAQAQAHPNITLAVGVGRFEETRNTGVSVGFSMPLPLFDRNQGAIREAQVRRVQTDAQKEAAFLRVRATLFSLYQELLASRKRLETLRTQAVPQAQRALEQTQSGYERGRFSYLELATAQEELLQLRATVIEAAAAYHQVLAEIERLTNEAVATAAPSQELP